MAKPMREEHELIFGFHGDHLIQVVGELTGFWLMRLEPYNELRIRNKVPIAHIGDVVACNQWNIFGPTVFVVDYILAHRRFQIRCSGETRPDVPDEMQLLSGIAAHRYNHLRWKLLKNGRREKIALCFELIDRWLLLGVHGHAEIQVNSVRFYLGDWKFAQWSADAMFSAD